MTDRRKDVTERRTHLASASLPGTVSGSYLAGVLHFATACGAGRAELLRAIGVDDDELAAPDRRFPLDRLRRLFLHAAERLNQPAFALHFGVGVPCTTLTLAAALAAARATNDAPRADDGRTLRDALDGLNRYASLGVDFGPNTPALRYRFVDSADGVWLEDCRPDIAAGYLWPALTESVFARFATGIRRRGGEQIVRALTVTHDAPIESAHREAYAAVFRAPVTFSTSRNAICLDPAFLERPLEPLPAPVETVLTTHAEAQLQQIARDRSWGGRVSQLLHANPGTDLIAVCRALAVSRHTLHRRLRDEGTTFVALQDAARWQLADTLLRRDRLTITAVAARLGYSEPAAFSRAYKRWTGTRPSAVISG